MSSCSLWTSLSARRVWIEIVILSMNGWQMLSLSARRVWIEILRPCTQLKLLRVTLCEESVDWNYCPLFSIYFGKKVTLCEESVDWNLCKWQRWNNFFSHSLRGECGLKFSWRLRPGDAHRVTLCEESVDWNCLNSLSPSRAIVTLCEESVDWNWSVHHDRGRELCHSLRGECGLKLLWVSGQMLLYGSLSARRVWIEMLVIVV